MIFRKAKLQDAPWLAQLSGILGYPVDVHLLSGRLESILPKADHAVFVAESPTDSVVGWIHAVDQEILEAGRSCEILGLVVAANQRRAGLGRRLVTEIERWATERGITQISVRSNIIRPESHQFYQGLGFVREKTQHVYRKDLASGAAASAG